MEPHHELLKYGAHYNPEGEVLLTGQVTKYVLEALQPQAPAQ